MNMRNLLCCIALGGSLVVASSAHAAFITKTDNVFGSVDGQHAFKTLSFDASEFAGSSTLLGVTLTVDFSKCGDGVNSTGCIDGSGTPFANEIGFALRSPDGTIVSLVENDGGNEAFEQGNFSTFISGSGNLDHIVITFDDSGAALGTLPVTGTFAPVGSLADFNGLSGIGDWVFFYEDDVGVDPLGIHSVTLRLQVADSSVAVPAPASLALLGAGLAGLGFATRRRARIADRHN